MSPTIHHRKVLNQARQLQEQISRIGGAAHTLMCAAHEATQDYRKVLNQARHLQDQLGQTEGATHTLICAVHEATQALQLRRERPVESGTQTETALAPPVAADRPVRGYRT